MSVSREKNRLNDLDGRNWIKNTISWFILKYASRPKDKEKHPATFPSELAEKFIQFFTKKGQWVLDPFAGTGSTLIGAKKLARNGIGIEITKEFASYARKQLSQATFDNAKQYIIRGNSMHVQSILNNVFKGNPPKIDFVFTSPPYWNILHKSRGGSDSSHKERIEAGLKQSYSSLEDDLGNCASYEIFLDTLIQIFVNIKPLLSDNTYLVLILQNFMNDDGKYVTMAWDIAYRLKEYYTLCPEQIWCQQNKKAGIWGFPTKYISNIHHQYCIVLKNETWQK